MLSELGKLRLSLLVVLTTACGFLLASSAAVEWPALAWTLLGTLLAAWGANALNQWIEAPRDERMIRTRTRPLPAREIRAGAALAWGLAASAAGPIVLALRVNELAAWLALITLALYVAVYTPLKVLTPANTLVGAVVGAIPPLIGGAGAAETITTGPLALAAILFLWQIPHFLSLAWLYRDDYARGGYRMLPTVDASGRLTAALCMLYSLALVPVGLGLGVLGAAGVVYTAGGLALGATLTLISWRLLVRRDDDSARYLFFASLLYLPLLMGLLIADRRPVERAMLITPVRHAVIPNLAAPPAPSDPEAPARGKPLSEPEAQARGKPLSEPEAQARDKPSSEPEAPPRDSPAAPAESGHGRS